MTYQILVKRIKSSLNKYFTTVAGPLRLYAEGQKIDMAGLDQWAELRTNGPRIHQLNGTQEIEIDVDIMFSCKANSNIYATHELAGKFADAMQVIPVFAENLTDKIGCFTLRNDVQHQLQIQDWGRVEPTNELSVMASSIEGFYRMEI